MFELSEKLVAVTFFLYCWSW